MERTYAEYAARQAMELLAIDSPTGFTARAADWVQRAFEELGYTARRTAKGGVLVDLGGRGEGLLNGRLRNNLVAEFAGDPALIGSEVQLHITGSRAAMLTAELA